MSKPESLLLLLRLSGCNTLSYISTGNYRSDWKRYTCLSLLFPSFCQDIVAVFLLLNSKHDSFYHIVNTYKNKVCGYLESLKFFIIQSYIRRKKKRCPNPHTHKHTCLSLYIYVHELTHPTNQPTNLSLLVLSVDKK